MKTSTATDSEMRSTTGAGVNSDDGDLTSPSNLRKLVLNYLVHHCYTETAIAFAKDGVTGDLLAGEGSSNGAGPSSAIDAKTKADKDSIKNAGTSVTRSAHPLSAPPLSRDDSSMEIEVESMLSAASEQPRLPTFQHSDDSDQLRNPHTSRSSYHEHFVDSTSNHDDDMDGDEEQDSSPDLTAEDLRAVRARQLIRDEIIDGHIRQAMDLCNTHFPSVLNAKAGSTSKTPPPRANDAASSGNRVLPANPTSLDPDHLLLNLQIQVFIEAIRSASSASLSGGAGMASSPPLSASGYLPLLAANTPGIAAAAAAISRSASPAPSSVSSNGSGTSGTGSNAAAFNPALHSALAYAQGLYTSAQKLPSYWRAMYLKELEQVTALLAYTDVEHSPVRRFLHRSRKVALAEQVNSAILFRTGKPSQPLIESAVRQTSFLWSHLNHEKVPVPSSHPIFTLVSPAATSTYDDSQATASANAKKQQSNIKTLPTWDFRSFLAER